ncbi:sulfurtransferase [Massilia antarctica]|uniref:sulfurtransferase n=1 Tax=Massilia antarctica TaxID=2765360 RepID=UPI0006BB6C93|nr:sulfurtransferase [Massilia sp. H27-R4]MCY0912872.1 sulfurtransferase [Massilia sp. H27-R4]CUI07447.1 Thiosulfate sulfurtransferase, rhodanese [Janthinobacterium sp. CG23_2]CUU31233.1 Thiosulfate sulfurtransferase, rhodanese [Janthinobacterium sp. CG23_2]
MYTTLISAADLAGHIDNPSWVIVDCRHDLMNLAAGREAYAAGHLPHALFADIETELSGAKRGADGVFRGRHPLPVRADLVETLRSWGIDDDSQVVAYDAHGGMFAARLWWMLRWVGHPAVAVLDGGLAAWQAAGLALSTAPQSPRSGTITERAPLVTTVSAADVLDNIKGGKRVVIDARAADRFRGENETIDPVGGHIPGAKNHFFKDNLGPDGRFKDAAQLKAELAPLVGNPQDAIMQCGSGVTACHNLLALEVAGLPGAALYPGSWSEWCADPARPVATGT